MRQSGTSGWGGGGGGKGELHAMLSQDELLSTSSIWFQSSVGLVSLFPLFSLPIYKYTKPFATFWPWPEAGVKNGRNHQDTN